MMYILKLFSGYLTDVKQSAHHKNCDAVNASAGNSTCSYDFYDGSRPYLQASGYESVELFAKRSVKLIENHATNDSSRVCKDGNMTLDSCLDR